MRGNLPRLLDGDAGDRRRNSQGVGALGMNNVFGRSPVTTSVQARGLRIAALRLGPSAIHGVCDDLPIRLGELDAHGGRHGEAEASCRPEIVASRLLPVHSLPHGLDGGGGFVHIDGIVRRAAMATWKCGPTHWFIPRPRISTSIPDGFPSRNSLLEIITKHKYYGMQITTTIRHDERHSDRCSRSGVSHDSSFASGSGFGDFFHLAP
jgi:hypothetical protein